MKSQFKPIWDLKDLKFHTRENIRLTVLRISFTTALHGGFERLICEQLRDE
jgi:hypothetical protein